MNLGASGMTLQRDDITTVERGNWSRCVYRGVRASGRGSTEWRRRYRWILISARLRAAVAVTDNFARKNFSGGALNLGILVVDRYVNFTARLTGTARCERRRFCEANCLNVRKSQRDNFKEGRVDCAVVVREVDSLNEVKLSCENFEEYFDAHGFCV